jgi:hypothetical protein
MTLVPHGNGWRIEGRGNERARLAYVKINGDKLVCAREAFVPTADNRLERTATSACSQIPPAPILR